MGDWRRGWSDVLVASGARLHRFFLRKGRSDAECSGRLMRYDTRKARRCSLRPVLIILVGGSLLLSQDHVGQAPAQADVDAGLRLYRANCSNCHGVEGTGVPGVDLGHNRFKRASNDEDLVRIIATGIQGTGMPPANIPREQALNIVAYLRSLAAPTTFQGGDATRGRELFAANGCVNCHRILGVGSRVGPDLSEIGSFRKPT